MSIKNNLIKDKETNNLSSLKDVLKIAKEIDSLKVMHISKDLIFRIAIQIHFLKKIELP